MNTHTCLPVISQGAEYRNKERNRFAFGCAIYMVFAKRECLGPSRHERKLPGLWFSYEPVIRFLAASPLILYYI